MTEVLTWGSLFASLVAIVTVAKFWMDMGATKRDARFAAEQSATNAVQTATHATELAEFKARVAEKYASVDMLAASEGRLASAIEGIRSDFREMTGRIDRLLGMMQPGK